MKHQFHECGCATLPTCLDHGAVKTQDDLMRRLALVCREYGKAPSEAAIIMFVCTLRSIELLPYEVPRRNCIPIEESGRELLDVKKDCNAHLGSSYERREE